MLDTTLNKLKGPTIEGNDLHLTLRPGAQRVALNALGGKCGAAVAIEPKTGRVLVSVSSPTYDPNLIENHYNLATKPKFGCAPLFNRAEQGLYVPGSAFKVVTASAALDSGKFTLDSTFHDPGYCIEYGKQVSNFADQSGPRFRHGQLHAGAPALDQRRLLRHREGARRAGRSSTTRRSSASTRCRRSRRL